VKSKALATPISLKGSCLCGAVSYHLAGIPAAFDLCHCSRCRKSGGSAFIAELVFTAAELRWLSGGPLVRTYEAPIRKTPPGYRRTFCAVCGGPVPIVDHDVIRVPAGSMDDDPELRPQRHIFVDFKAPWFDIADTLPRFSTK
jgi:hypothetical protein